MSPRNFLCIAGILLLFTGCQQSSVDKIIVLQTGRMAGNVYPSELRGLAPLQHYPYLAAYVKQVRKEAEDEGAQVLLIDSGDSFLGSFASYATQAQNVVTLFNELEYDAVFLGNLDANLDEKMLDALKAPVLIPFVDKDGEPALKKASVGLKLRKGKHEVVLLPNFYGNLDKNTAPHRFPVWFGNSSAETQPLRDYHPVLKSIGALAPDALMLFHWMKFEPEVSVPHDYLQELKVLGVDAILAHSIYSSSERDTWGNRDFSGWGLPVSENILRQNRGFTVARMDLERTATGWKEAGPARVVPLNGNLVQADPDIIKKLDEYAAIIRLADEVLGDLKERVGEESLLKYQMSLLSRIEGANMVFYSEASVRGTLDAGNLTAGKLYNAFPWTNEIRLIQLTPEEFAGMKQLSGYALLSRPGSALKPSLVTSAYFARLLQASLGIEESRIIKASALNEFDFVKAAIKGGGPLPSANPELGGWIYERLE